MALGVLESNVRSRVGPPELSADLMLIAPHMVAVVSGVAFSVPPEATLPHGMPPARFAATVGVANLRELPPQLTLPEAVEHLNQGLQRALRHVQPAGKPLGVAFSFAAVHQARREVWRVGSVGAIWDDMPGVDGPEESLNLLPSLAVVGRARSLILHALLARSEGHMPDSLRVNDPSLPMITSLLVAHNALANTVSPLGYGLVNGQPVPEEHLHVAVLPPGPREVCLASGGYPVVRGTLGATERHLTQLLRDDPLLITRFPYVRPLKPGYEGYADRVYARVRVW